MDNMVKENHTDDHIEKIQKEYKKINSRWLLLHYRISVIMVVFILLVECGMSVMIIHSDMLHTTLINYILKFIILPSGLNFLLIALDTLVIKSKKIPQNLKIYIVSFVFVGVCFIIFSAHITFSATYFIFTAAIMLTTIYASYYVTSMTAVMCVLSIVISELFVKWDADKISIFHSVFRFSNFVVSLIILVSFYIISLIIIQFEQKKNEASIQLELERNQLEQSLQEDEMTGIYNRRAFQEAMNSINKEASDDDYILAIVDVDHFKEINDHWGHHNGDRCLKELAGILKENSKNYTPFRYGGDEFCLLFHNIDMEMALADCEKIQSDLQQIHIEELSSMKLTASIGLAAYTNQMDAVRLFIHSDYALYKAKEVRNKIHIYNLEEDDSI